MGVCCSSEIDLHRRAVRKYYIDFIADKLKKYSFDEVIKDQFAGRVAKENNTTTEVTKAWLKYYIAFMIYIGWLFGNKEVKKRKPTININEYLTIPYEILQVWKAHILFTNKYKEFCLIVSNGKKEFIPFTPPKEIWKNGDVRNLQKAFRKNKQMISVSYPKDKKELDSLFIFQSNYLKNRINFNLEARSSILQNIINKYEIELNNQNGIFSTTARSLTSLQSLVGKIDDLIKASIVPENPPGGEDWVLFDQGDNLAKIKLPIFQHLVLPDKFIENFCVDHILPMELGSQYVDNYKRFLFLMSVTKVTQTPSEEVDLVWHYHLMYVEEYLKFSKATMDTNMLAHNPAIGEKGEHKKMVEQYEKTIAFLVQYFGSANENIWPNSQIRFKEQSFKWYNHHNILQRCNSYASKNTKVNKVISRNEVYFIAGCYIGCGYIYGGYYMGCGGLIGCGGVGCAAGPGCGGGCSGGCGGGDGGGCGGGDAGGDAGGGCGGGDAGGGCGGGGCGGGCGGGGCGGGCGG